MIDDIYDVIEQAADIIEFVIDLFKHKNLKITMKFITKNNRKRGLVL